MKQSHLLSLGLILMLIASSAQAQRIVDFKITTWNSEWLSCSEYGPEDDDLQVNNIATVIAAMNSDVVALQEVGTSSYYATIDTLVKRLGNEWGGAITPFAYNNCSQNQGIIYKKSKVQILNSSLVTNGGSSFNWSNGRFPALYNLLFLANGNTIPVSLINIHAKASSDEQSYTRRKGASEGLKTLLDGNTYNSKRVVLIGDFNDYMLGTQCYSYEDSPYKNFVDDTENYFIPTQTMTDYNYGRSIIDHVILSNELAGNYVPNSATRENSVTQVVENYTNTTSDHIPVSILLRIENNPSGECTPLAYSETFAENLGEFTIYNRTGYQSWYWRQTYGACVSGFQSNVNNENEDWLISPAFDLSHHRSATLRFNHALNFCPSEIDKLNNHTLWFSTDYTDGSPENATWAQFVIPSMPSGNNWTYVPSGNINLPAGMLQSSAPVKVIQ